MTREDAIDLLDNLIGMIEDNHNSDYDKALKMAIKSLEQEPILDKIRAEIYMLSDSERNGTTITLYSWEGMKKKVLEVIDKYEAESEVKDENDD